MAKKRIWGTISTNISLLQLLRLDLCLNMGEFDIVCFNHGITAQDSFGHVKICKAN